MKRMSSDALKNCNGGSVRCNVCGATFWGTSEGRFHVASRHGHGSYSWYWSGPTSGYTPSYVHHGLIGTYRV